jgi:hypothetical protein
MQPPFPPCLPEAPAPGGNPDTPQNSSELNPAPSQWSVTTSHCIPTCCRRHSSGSTEPVSSPPRRSTTTRMELYCSQLAPEISQARHTRTRPSSMQPASPPCSAPPPPGRERVQALKGEPIARRCSSSSKGVRTRAPQWGVDDLERTARGASPPGTVPYVATMFLGRRRASRC